MNKNIIEIRDIHKSFSQDYINLLGQKDIEKSYILDGVSLGVEKGKITALIGGNGSGKSTLFNIVSNLIKPDTVYKTTNYCGEVLYHTLQTHSLLNTPPHKLAQLGIGRLFQGTHIFKNLTLLENMLLADSNPFGEVPFTAYIFRKKYKEIEMRKTLKAEYLLSTLLGEDNVLWQKRNDLAGNLSYGQQRLLAMARLFMNEHLQLLMLDEPCAGVNPDIVSNMKQILLTFVAEGKSVLLIEHNALFVKEVADFAYYLESGKVTFADTPQNLFQHPEIKLNYIGNHA